MRCEEDDDVLEPCILSTVALTCDIGGGRGEGDLSTPRGVLARVMPVVLEALISMPASILLTSTAGWCRSGDGGITSCSAGSSTTEPCVIAAAREAVRECAGVAGSESSFCSNVRFSRARMRSSASVTVLGGSSLICSQPTGGLPGGLMRKFLSVTGTGKCFSLAADLSIRYSGV